MRILRVLSSYQLPCGCLVGVYELYSNEIVSLVDERGDECEDARHSLGSRVEEPLTEQQSL
jgi:hypothetical protein